ncbi:MAG TPA: FAD:protein FMN transferase [Candidatus Binatia bacterium]
MIRYQAAHEAMGTEFALIAYGDDTRHLTAVGNEVFEEIDRLDSQMSNYKPRSELSAINRAAAFRSVRVEPRLFQLLVEAIGYSRATGGAFDVTAGPLVKAWGFFHGRGRVPNDAQIAQILTRVGYHRVNLNPADCTIRFGVEGLELDLGAVGKGYAVDRAADILRTYGVTRALVSAGTSSILALGAPPGAEGWPITLRDPYDGAKAADVVHIKNYSLSISGNYEKFFTLGGKIYSHILNPGNGRPVGNILAATVLAARATEAEALSTAFYVMGVERSGAYLGVHPDLTAVFYLPEEGAKRFRRAVLRSALTMRSGFGSVRGYLKSSRSTRSSSAAGLPRPSRLLVRR